MLQKIFENCYEEDYIGILEMIKERVLDIVSDQYGNYVIQHILEYQDDKHKLDILQKLSGRVFELSIHKYSSNVIEKLLNYGSQPIRQIIIDELISTDDKYKYEFLI